ncbi:MAG: glycosyltransferase family 4 protein [Pirellulales bacterium]|nr:glycosyltransferase family 4 protein [Pirellulales bacterium]
MASPVHVLHVSDREDAAAGVGELARRLPAARWRTSLVPLRREPACGVVLRRQGVPTTSLAGRSHVDPIMLGRLARLLRRSEPQAIHAWGISALMAATLTRPRSPLVPLATSCDMRDSLPPWGATLVKAVRGQVQRWFAADEATRNWLASCGVERTEIAIVPMPVAPLQQPVGERGELLATWRFPAEARVLATAGDLHPWARFDDAIWCYELVRVLHSAARLVIAGTGPAAEHLRRYADQVSEPGCVVVDERPEALAEALASAEAYWQLGPAAVAPAGLVQAMLAGLPIVASAAPPHREALGLDQTAAKVVRLGNRAEVARATDDLFQSETLREQLGDEARRRAAEAFDPARLADQFAAGYETLGMRRWVD